MTQETFKYKFNKILLVLLAFSTISCTSNDEISIPNQDDNNDDTITDIQPLEETQILNVSYGNNNQQKYDIYLPEGRTKETTKVFILIHGGSWTSGDKSSMDNYVSYLKNNFNSHAIVNINYRLSTLGNPPFPMQIDDIKTIISDLKSKAETYQISNQYGFIGRSAGAQLSMLYSYKYDLNSEVNMVCSIVGPTNFTDSNYVNNPDFTQQLQAYELILGATYEDNPEYFESLSPYHVVTTFAPPTLLFYGDSDHLIPTSQGVDLHTKLNNLNIVNEFTLYEGEGHGNWSNENIEDSFNKLNTFINNQF